MIQLCLGFRNRCGALIMKIKKKIRELDLFPTIPPSQDEKILRRNRRLTRIYLTLLFISLLTIAIYTLITQDTITVNVKSPSLLRYSELITQYPLTFQCFCSNVTVKYHKFITQIELQNHSICSSDFLSPDRFETIWNGERQNAWDYYDYSDDDDFRTWIKAQLEAVSKMCTISGKILDSSLTVWLQKDFVTARVISHNEFETQIKESMEELKRTIANELVLLVKLIQVTNVANQLATRQSSNWQFIVSRGYSLSSYSELDLLDPKIHQNALHSLTLPKIYNEDNCSCALQLNCSKYSSFRYRVLNRPARQTLPNFRTGCLPMNSLLQSSFSCFFNETCLYLLQTSIYFANSFPVTILTAPAHSSLNRAIETIFSQIFVEKWSENASFEDYYDECAPRFCQYSYPSTFNKFYFITKTLALFGGLSKVLHYALSWITVIVIKILNYKKKTKVIPQSNVVVVDVNDANPQMISNELVTTVEIDASPVQEQIVISKNRTDRIIMICLCLLVLITIVVTSVILIKKRNTKYISPTVPITTVVSNAPIMESTTTSIQSCYMTLIYQSAAYEIGHDAKSLIIHDFNRDSFLDLAVTNHGNHTFSILFGNGNGKFQAQQIYPTGNQSYPWGITAADFNNDSFPDIAVTLSKKKQIAIFFGIAWNGSFATVPHTLNSSNGYAHNSIIHVVEANDLNDDGFIDLLIGSRPIIELSGGGDLFARLNRGDGRQYAYTRVQTNMVHHVESIVIGDFDNDGKHKDISVCSDDIGVITLTDIAYKKDVSGASNISGNIIHGKPQTIIKGRFNDDELDDMALVAPESNTLHILLADGDRNFSQQIYHTDNYPVSVVRINFNNDSIDDLAILTCNQTITIYLGTKLGIFFDHNKISFSISESSGKQCFRSLKVADLNHDGKDDLVFISPDTERIRVLLSASCD
ncbi:unnamed protein product [Adineta steineri]|uniref:Uncharacterized protein n=1 Tax=Adineta steineri TaxID=433720 RepID=A0A815CZR0_9BILA|nr:unnamed protein product [Adineta steineri]CAF1299026.1 unnamed protein product [Adineta steineri]